MLLLLNSTPTSYAQEEPVDLPFSLEVAQSEPPSTTGNLVCLDYFNISSIDVDIKPSVNQTTPGATVTFGGSISNTSDHPIVSGVLRAKILRSDEDIVAAGLGGEVVDQVVVASDVTMPGQGSVAVDYEWMVPNSAEGGDYYVAYYFTANNSNGWQADAYVSDSVEGDPAFTVETDSDSTLVTLEKSATTINGESYDFSKFPPRIDSQEPVVITSSLTNDSSETKTVPLQWRQYASDSLDTENIVNTKTEIVTLAPNETKTTSYTVKETRDAIVHVSVTTEDDEVKSILNIQYAKQSDPQTKINLLGVTQFPLAADTENILFACARTINAELSEGNSLTLTLTDKSGEVIHSYTYEGDISAALSGFGETFIPTRNYNYAVLTATLERDGVVLEEASIEYDCEAIDPSACLDDKVQSAGFIDLFIDNLLYVLAAIVVFLLGLYLLWSVRKRHGIHEEKEGGDNSLNLLLLLLILPAVFLGSALQAEAKSVTWNGNADEYVIKYFNQNNSYYQKNYNYSGYIETGVPQLIDVRYEAIARKISSGNTLISDGDAIEVGSIIEFTPSTFSNQDITLDDPYGRAISGIWSNSLSGPPVSCNPDRWWTLYSEPGQGTGDTIGGSFTLGDTHNVFLDSVFLRPSVSYEHRGTAGLSCNATGSRCTVTSAGTISSSVIFSGTQARFYQREAAAPGQFYGTPNTSGCRGDNIPLNITPERLTQTQEFTHMCYTVPNVNHPSTSDFYCPLLNTGSTYTLSVPAQTITFNLTAVGGNNPPATPAISGPTSGNTNTSHTFTVSGGNDPDGDQIRYGLTDSSCTTVNQWLPGSGYFTPGSQTYQRSWGSAGSYTMYVLAEDANGARSGCAQHTIAVSTAPAAAANLTINGSDGPLTVGKNDTLNLAWTSSNASTCSLYGAGLPGGVVALSGNASVSARSISSSPESYVLSCSGATDSVSVTVQNQPPNAPTISGPTSGETSQNNTFGFTATDPDNDQIYYEIDWDNNGSVDVSTPGSSYVSSGTTLNGTRSWSGAGSYTFQVRTVDFDNARSPWTQHTITITQAAPPTATIEASVNNGSWSSSNVTIGAQDDVRIRWSSANASSCSAASGSGFSASGTSGTDNSVNEPAAGNNETFSVNCGGATASLTVTSELADLSIAAWVLDVDQNSFNGTTYGNGTVRFTHSNVTSRSAVPATTATLSYGSNPTVNTPGLSGGQEYGGQLSIPISNINLGTFSANLTVNQPQSVNEKTRSNNTVTVTGAVPPPNPGLFIRADRIQVRPGDTVELTWGAANPYPMNCRVQGPGVDETSTNTIPAGTANPAISAKSEYTITCTHPAATAPFSASVVVETIGVLEEV